ncbi:MAG: M48 family metalloprotease [Pseudomonadota bacterium]
MNDRFITDAEIAAPLHGFGCACHGRRLFTGALLGAGVLATVPAVARDGVEVDKQSSFSKLVPAEQIEQAADQQYRQMVQQAAQKRALAPPDHPQVQRLRAIAQRIIPYTNDWNERARRWNWEVNLIGSKDLNAFCMPGGKIAFFYGLLQNLQLSDDEVAMVMGHEMAHALREHARERMGKTAATRIGASLISSLFGLGNAGDALLNMGSQLLTLRFSREDESEADLVGMELAARAGYDPKAGVSLWTKMLGANKNAPPQFLSTHPSGPTRIRDIEANLPRVEPLYARAQKPPRQFGPPPQKAG